MLVVRSVLRTKETVVYVALVIVISREIITSFVFSCLFILNEMRPHPWLIFRHADAVLPSVFDALQQPCHVLSQDAHGLQAFLVLAHVVGREAVH